MSEWDLPSSATHFTVHEEPVRHSPLDLRQKRFSKAFLGWDPDEVMVFLNEVADDYDRILRHLGSLEEEVVRLEASLADHRERESTLRNTLVTAQKMADEVRDAAQQEARIIVGEAEARTDLLLEKAQGRLEEVERQIGDLRHKRRSVEGTVESSIAALQQALDLMRGQDRVDRDERILLHRPRHPEAPARDGEADFQSPPRRAEWDD